MFYLGPSLAISLTTAWWLPTPRRNRKVIVLMSSRDKIGHKKTVGFPCFALGMCLGGVLLKQVNVDKLLGVLVPVDNTPDPTLQDKRVLGAQAFLPGIVKLPVPLEEKAALIALKTAGWPIWVGNSRVLCASCQ